MSQDVEQAMAGWPRSEAASIQALAGILTDGVPAELAFLRVVDAHADVLYYEDVLKLAVARYALLWLPLCTKAPGRYLRPPIDIAFVWHCHVLNPTRCARHVLWS